MREVMKYYYKTKDGRVVGHVSRLEELVSGDSKTCKKTIPHFNDGGQAGIPDGMPATHRVYGLETVQDNLKPVYVVEGEKCAYALHTLGLQAVSTVGGCGSVHLADLSDLNDVKQCVLLPDNDDAGKKFMYRVFKKLQALDDKPDTKLLELPELHEKGDICDYLASMSDLQGWNEIDSLEKHPKRAEIVEHFKGVVDSFMEDVPASWKFIVTKSKHKLISVNDFNAMKLPQRELMLTPWLASGSINMVFADRGIGKTFFCLSCAVALANGEDFLGYKASKPVPVLYLDGEMQAASMQYRLRQLTKGEPTKAPLSIFTPDCQDLTDHIPDVGNRMGRSEIDELVAMVNPKVIFIDNISTFIRTGNENEGDSWAPVQEWAVQLRKHGISVVFVHHANKEGKQRGSHKKEDVMDVVIQLKRPDDYLQGTDDTRMLIRYTKARHLEAKDAEDIEATLKMVDGNLEWDWQAGDMQLQRALALLKDGMSMSDVAEEFGVSKSTVHRWKNKGIEQGKL